ncbi:hypothetical protein [Massilia soli]|uniref:CD225/dispanin family protein n=1 Tax=Massilia soli TaxID=2792854 RepID=A0ABS7SND9_9BURK|nr:hypothetical protein [Massilia soli]MBZ2207567.1 hypothetical protein [Massilia soli]
MNNQPSNRSAAFAGIWTGLGVLPYAIWSGSGAFSSGLAENALWLGVAAIFIFLPAVYFVVGPDGVAFSRNWVNNPVEREKYLALLTRMAAWIATAALVGGVLLMVQKSLG